jgi:TPR repeat protein
VQSDHAEAIKWYGAAANQGNADAQSNLGKWYENGLGVPQDYAAALTWYRKGADQGSARAQLSLGNMYADGRGVTQDYLQAHKWFNLALSRFSASETEGRNLAVKNRDLAAAKMTPAQVAEAQSLAREWKPR